MKIKANHYRTLSRSMLETRINDSRIDHILTTMEQSPEYSNERTRWDWLWCTSIDGQRAEHWLVDNLGYLKDNHIDTALKAITGLR